MTLVGEQTPVVSWNEPDGIAARGTLILIPGRGERPELYERFGRRISADGYRVRAVADPVQDEELTISQVLAETDGTGLHVLVGSDTGALFAAGLVASGSVTEVDALVLAGLPTTDGDSPQDIPSSWEGELDARTACPTHRVRLEGPALSRGALYKPVPEGWAERADLTHVPQPVLGVHGADDQVSPLAAARARYAIAPRAELVSITGGKHDALNDATHRTAAATVVMFLERLRLGADLPLIAVSEHL
jgi:pimeloyl-ACP methyl ester carboxylesterase